LGARLNGIEKVVGSNPTRSTKWGRHETCPYTFSVKPE
jgi:hypothetical protein